MGFFDPTYLETVYAALLQLLTNVEFPDTEVTTWATPPQRCIVLPEQVPSANQPALFLYQGVIRRDQSQVIGPSKDRFFAVAIIYVQADPVDLQRAATLTNYIVWSVVNLFNTTPPYQKQTLGGLVYHCWIEGEIVPETNDQQIVITVPINILPN